MLFYLIAFLVTVGDQIIKIFVHQHMYLGQSIPIINDIIKITYVQNTGAAFSLFVGFSPYLAVVGIVVVAAVIYFHYQIPKGSYVLQLSLAFVLGGSLGNLVDRILYSFVIDYLDITIWPVFNLADLMINIGVIMLIYKLFEKEENEKEDKNVPGTV